MSRNNLDLPIRPRRNRKSSSMRSLIRESEISPADLVLPIFVTEGENAEDAINSMPGVARLSLDRVVEKAGQAQGLGIPAVALFPVLADPLKDSRASESTNPDGLLQRTVRELKDHHPDLLVITDVAMDPYSSEGHDGLVQDGEILNDPTLDILAAMAISQAEAGADIVAPSDMMDGRVGVIRQALDENGWSNVNILAYSAKYASSFYGPFRDALDSSPRAGDKKTYQMDPANSREAVREVFLDIEEGADMVMVKPALAYLDVIARLRPLIDVPLAAYSVSGEYSMVQAAEQRHWLDAEAVMMEILTSIKRAGADFILTYFAVEAARYLNDV